MGVLLGFDPGGAGTFGWCVARDSVWLPLEVLASGVTSHAKSAVAAAISVVPSGQEVLAAGIDAPLVWARSGPRNCDLTVRQAIRQAGAKHSAGTVQDVNSLRGACLVQGILAGLELREAFPSLPLTEAHPKALRWLCSESAKIVASTDHERDAILGAFAAWALVHSPSGWCDLYLNEVPYFTPLPRPLAYLMPLTGRGHG